MKSEKLFEAFTELDDDLIENAMPQSSDGRDYEVVKPAMKMNSWKPWVAGVAVAAAAFGVVFAGFKLFGGGKPIIAPAVETSENSSAVGAAADEVKYGSMIVDWVVYDTVEDLVNASDIICTGKVNDISFALIDPATEMEIEDGDDPSNGGLYTIYDIEVTKMYCDRISKGRLWFRVMGGLKDYKVDEQLELLKKTGSDTIMLMSNPPEIELGESYLFLLADFNYAPAGGSSLPTLVNAPQGVFPLSDPTYRDRFSGASAQDIINCVEGNAAVNNYAELSIIHENQQIDLSKIDRDALAAAVRDALTDKENLANMNLSDWLLKEYSNTGYVIDVVFNDIDAPLAGGGNDKKAQTICHVTVLVGEYFTSSHIAYSYTSIGLDGSSENYDGGLYFLDEKTRDAILALVNTSEQSHHNGVYEPVCLFDYFDDPDIMPLQYGTFFTLPEYPGVSFDWVHQSIMAHYDNDKVELFMGSPVYGVYLADLDGDGKREICSTVSMGSGEIDNRILAYNFANGNLYELRERDTSDFALTVNDGVLCYVHNMHSASSVNTNPLTAGVMTCHSDNSDFCHTGPSTTTSHHEEESSHHDEPEHTTVAPAPAVTAGTHHDETHH